VNVGYAPHSLRAVPREWLVTIAGHAERTGYPLHIHAGEQPREVEESLEEFGLRPIEHLGDCGVLGPAATVVHATHVSPGELELLAETGSTVCACPTTEANLGDGFLPAAELWELGVPVSFGADSNVRLDPFEEARETEGCARRLSGRRNVLVSAGDDGPAPSLWRCLTDHGARSLGLEVPGIVAGGAADLIALDLEHPEIRAVEPQFVPAAVLFSGTAALVRETWVAVVPASAVRA
jgi:formimidoylglutamate deiminase